jgi:AcrR family transcriptional regulator
MARPSQNIDQRLLESGLAMLPVTGCAGLSVRRVAEHAGVNLGMFHYHFRSKENFIRAVLLRVYEAMFAELTMRTTEPGPPLDQLRRALTILAQFGRRHRHLLARIMADAVTGEPLAAEFLQANLPRHIAIVAQLVRKAQADGAIVKAPYPQLVGFLAGAVGAPVLLAGALHRSAANAKLAGVIDRHVLSTAAITRRIDFALRGVAAPGAGA